MLNTNQKDGNKMKKIITMSVYDCVKYVLDDTEIEPYVIISIQDSQNGFGIMFNKTKYCKDVLTLYFDDMENEVPGLKLFTQEDAYKIINFVEQYNDISKIIVHCYAGQSRSASVAIAIAEKYKPDVLDFVNDSTPNQYVYKILSECFGDHE